MIKIFYVIQVKITKKLIWIVSETRYTFKIMTSISTYIFEHLNFLYHPKVHTNLKKKINYNICKSTKTKLLFHVLQIVNTHTQKMVSNSKFGIKTCETD